ncbi:hypothetical protein [Streptomyces misionensis]
MVTTVKRLWTALRSNAGRVGWALAEGAIGALVGLLAAAAYLRYR